MGPPHAYSSNEDHFINPLPLCLPNPDRPVLLRDGKVTPMLPLTARVLELEIKIPKQSCCDLANFCKGKLFPWTPIVSSSEGNEILLVGCCLGSHPSIRVEHLRVVAKVSAIALNDE